MFKEVRNYECFKYLHLGITSPIKRKSLPEIAKVVSINSAQSLHHFIANCDWSVEELKKRRLDKIKKALKGKAITVVVDETGDRKKGKKTDKATKKSLEIVKLRQSKYLNNIVEQDHPSIKTRKWSDEGVIPAHFAISQAGGGVWLS